MKVFISWSGDRSRGVAEALEAWLPLLLHPLDAWVSTQDITPGKRWSDDLARGLGDCAAGIFCVTPENLDSVWMAFEAGSLCHAPDVAITCPYLIDLEPEALAHHPYGQFQSVPIRREGTRKLVFTLNAAMGAQARSEDALGKLFEKFWPELHVKLATLAPNAVEPLLPGIDELTQRFGEFTRGAPRAMAMVRGGLLGMVQRKLSGLLTPEVQDSPGAAPPLGNPGPGADELPRQGGNPPHRLPPD
jgi:hypothetical protein